MKKIVTTKVFLFTGAAALSILLGCGSTTSEDEGQAGIAGTTGYNPVTGAGKGAGGSAVTGAGGATVVGAGGVAVGSGGTTTTGGAGGGLGGTGGTSGAGATGGTAGMAGMAGMSGAKAGAGGAAGAAGASGASGASGQGGAAGAAGTAGTAAKPPCLTDPDQVVLIGDSYIEWVSHTFPEDLADEAGVTYRNYAQPGYSMASGGLGLIPPEFDKAISDDPNIIAAVMTGGGNDVLIADTAQYPDGGLCNNDRNSPNIEDCQKIGERALATTADLLDRMAKAGVKDIVYFFYPHVPEGTVAGGAYPNEISDYNRPKYKALCDGANVQTGGKLNCYFLDLIPVLDDENGNPDLVNFAFYIDWDIHPNTIGSRKMARAVWSIMKEKCIAQPASSGCCAP